MKFELNEYHRNVEDDQLIRDLQRVANLLNANTVTIDDYNQHGNFHATTLTRRFGSWFACLDRAGLKASRSKIGISNEELFEEIENVWTRLGKQPTYQQMQNFSRYSLGTYEHRFGSYRKALEAFVNYINSTDDEYESPYSHSANESKQNTCDFEEKNVVIHRTSRTINLRMRFKVLQNDHFKCRACGASPSNDPSVELQVDHITPWAKGGETVIDNLQTLCSKCNLGKGDLYEN